VQYWHGVGKTLFRCKRIKNELTSVFAFNRKIFGDHIDYKKFEKRNAFSLIFNDVNQASAFFLAPAFERNTVKHEKEPAKIEK
jgi:hypothetical protein